ncbi:MAG TPA: polyketide cyclase, partial [Sphingobacterium sp.]|nr:polyketide cyclase [Sphingobacterium sp.]
MIMKIIRKILIVLAVIIAIPLITAIFVSKDFSAQSEITIDKPKQEVFNYVKMLKNQDNFGVWQLSDPE